MPVHRNLATVITKASSKALKTLPLGSEYSILWASAFTRRRYTFRDRPNRHSNEK